MTRRSRRTLLVALALLAPNFLGFLVFTAGPVVFSMVMAFTNWNLTLHNQYSQTAVEFVGLENFRALILGPDRRYFHQYLHNTLYLMLGIPIGVSLSLIGALLLSGPLPVEQGRGKRRAVGIVLGVTLASQLVLAALGVPPLVLFFLAVTSALVLLGVMVGQTSFRTLFYLPNLTSGVAVFILWKALYQPENGPVNRTLRPFLDALAGAVRATPAEVWHVLGGVILLGAAAMVLASVLSSIARLGCRDTTLIGAFFTVLGVGVLAAAAAGFGWVVVHLPQTVAAQGGLSAPEWLTSTVWSKPAIMLMGLFAAMGSNNMLLYLAALTNVPASLQEAAEIDGASRWQSFWNITWPQLAPTTFFIVIMSTIGGLQGGFEQARVMTNGGPAGSTTTLSYYLYQKGFADFQLGFASAIAWTMFLMIFTLTLINWRFGNSLANE